MKDTKYPIIFLSSIAIALLSILIFISAKDSAETQTENQPLTEISSQPYIPKEVTFCGQKVPIENFDVYEALDYEMIVNMYRHSATITYLKKANRYFPEIEKILSEKNMPDDLKYLCVAESGLSNVVSNSGATGFWQFMKTTGTEFGMRIDSNVDQRYDPIISAYAACEYFKDAYKTFNDWALVAASYNMGIGGVKKAIDNQKTNSYWDLNLNSETARYVYRIIALKLIMENPSTYGFNLKDEDLYEEIETYTITVDTTIDNLTNFALDNGTTIKMLKYFNPWLRTNCLPNASRKEYSIIMPKTRTRKSRQN